jgi:hypothetical protein
MGAGAGRQADAIVKLGKAIQMIQEALMGLPVGSDIHKAANKAIGDLARHVPVGPDTQGVQQTAGQDLRRQQVAQALLGAIKGGGGPQPMAPALPLPGA